MAQDFTGRIALVTGAASGLGRAYALWLAKRGAIVIANNRTHARRPEGAADTVAAIRAAGGRASIDRHDLAETGAGRAMIKAAIAAYGRLDILVANAAANVRRSALELSSDDLREGMQINFWGSVEPVLTALPAMVAQDYGRIVLTTSAAGLFGQREHAAYAAAKMAVTGFGRALAIDAAKRNIRVNIVSPYAWTEMARHVLPPAVEKLMTADRVAKVVGWLASDDCTVTGQIIATGAGRMRRNTMVEGPIIEIGHGDPGEAFEAIARLKTISEPRNSGHSGLQLIPELKQEHANDPV